MMQRAWSCPGCSRPVVFDNWISQNSDKQIATAACDCGCAYFARIHSRKSTDKYRCHRIVYPLTEAHISFYNERKDIARYKAERHLNMKQSGCRFTPADPGAEKWSVPKPAT